MRNLAIEKDKTITSAIMEDYQTLDYAGLTQIIKFKYCKQRYIFIQLPLFEKAIPEECGDDMVIWFYVFNTEN